MPFILVQHNGNTFYTVYKILNTICRDIQMCTCTHAQIL